MRPLQPSAKRPLEKSPQEASYSCPLQGMAAAVHALKSLGGSLSNVVNDCVASSDALKSLGGSLSDVVSISTVSVGTMLRTARRRSLSETDLSSLLPPDFTWEELGTEKPAAGEEISHELLRQAIDSSGDSIAGLPVVESADVSFGSFVRLGDKYYAMRPRVDEEKQTESNQSEAGVEMDALVQNKTHVTVSSQNSLEHHLPPRRYAKHDQSSIEERRNHNALLTAVAQPSYYEANPHPDLDRAKFWHSMRSMRRKSESKFGELSDTLQETVPLPEAIRALKRQLKNRGMQEPAGHSHLQPRQVHQRQHQNHRKRDNHHHTSHDDRKKHILGYDDGAHASMVSKESNRLHLEELSRLDDAIAAEHKRLVAEQVGPAPHPARAGRRRSLSDTDLRGTLQLAKAQLAQTRE